MALHFGCLLTLALTPEFHPMYKPEVSASMQRWGVSALRQNIKDGYVQKVAFLHDESAVEVLDVNGLQRRVLIFPEMSPLLVEDMHKAHVPFFVAPAPWEPPEIVIAVARAFILTLIVIAMIDAFGFTEQFVFGCILMGDYFLHLAAWTTELVEVGVDEMKWHMTPPRLRNEVYGEAQGEDGDGEVIYAWVEEDEEPYE